jgi:hypothetical protein
MHNTLYMSWPGDTILLLAKNKGTGAKTSNVYLSTNFGRNWTNINSKFLRTDNTNAVIDQIYVSKVNPKMVSFTANELYFGYASNDLFRSFMLKSCQRIVFI